MIDMEPICKNCVYWRRERSGEKIRELRQRDLETAEKFRKYSAETTDVAWKALYTKFADRLTERKVYGRMICEDPITISNDISLCLNGKFIAKLQQKVPH